MLNVIAQFCQYSNYQQAQDGGGDQPNDGRYSHEATEARVGTSKAQRDRLHAYVHPPKRLLWVVKSDSRMAAYGRKQTSLNNTADRINSNQQILLAFIQCKAKVITGFLSSVVEPLTQRSGQLPLHFPRIRQRSELRSRLRHILISERLSERAVSYAAFCTKLISTNSPCALRNSISDIRAR